MQAVESIHDFFIIPRYFIDITQDMPPNQNLLQPAAAATFLQNLTSMGKNDLIAHCKPTGVPAIMNLPIPFKIIQTEKIVVILYEEGSVFRQIFLDGRKTVEDPQPRWMGYSTGKMDGETLVVDTVGFTSKSWLDRLGHTHSESMRVTERYRRTDIGFILIEALLIIRSTFTKPIKYTQKATLYPMRICWNTSAPKTRKIRSTISNEIGDGEQFRERDFGHCRFCTQRRSQDRRAAFDLALTRELKSISRKPNRCCITRRMTEVWRLHDYLSRND